VCRCSTEKWGQHRCSSHCRSFLQKITSFHGSSLILRIP